jgi:hypothetical protein
MLTRRISLQGISYTLKSDASVATFDSGTRWLCNGKDRWSAWIMIRSSEKNLKGIAVPREFSSWWVPISELQLWFARMQLVDQFYLAHEAARGLPEGLPWMPAMIWQQTEGRELMLRHHLRPKGISGPLIEAWLR